MHFYVATCHGYSEFSARTGDGSRVVTDVHESLRTHGIVFAAERARREGRMVDLAEIYDAD